MDLFLFSYYTGGMVNVDVCHLTYNMIQGNQVIYERMKFPKIGKPLLIEKSKTNYWETWRSRHWQLCIPRIHKKTYHGGQNQISNRVSKTLTKVCNILDIKENITWYSARDTFISRMVDAGCSPAVTAEKWVHAVLLGTRRA